MAITFVEIQNKKDILFNISDPDLDKLEEIIEQFNERFDNLFDFYSDFRLYDNHIDYLISLTGNPALGIIFDFNRFLKEIRAENKVLFVVGD